MNFDSNPFRSLPKRRSNKKFTNFDFNRFSSLPTRPFLQTSILQKFDDIYKLISGSDEKANMRNPGIIDICTLGIPLGLMALANVIKPINGPQASLDNTLRSDASSLLYGLGEFIRFMASMIITAIIMVFVAPVSLITNPFNKPYVKPTEEQLEQVDVDDNKSYELQILNRPTAETSINSSQYQPTQSFKNNASNPASVSQLGHFAQTNADTQNLATEDQQQTQSLPTLQPTQ